MQVDFSTPTPVEEILQLREGGASLSAVAEATGTTINRVRRLVPRLDRDGLRRQQEEKAKAIDALPLTWTEKAKRWEQETGTSGTTFWRVCQRLKG